MKRIMIVAATVLAFMFAGMQSASAGNSPWTHGVVTGPSLARPGFTWAPYTFTTGLASSPSHWSCRTLGGDTVLHFEGSVYQQYYDDDFDLMVCAITHNTSYQAAALWYDWTSNDHADSLSAHVEVKRNSVIQSSFTSTCDESGPFNSEPHNSATPWRCFTPTLSGVKGDVIQGVIDSSQWHFAHGVLYYGPPAQYSPAPKL